MSAEIHNERLILLENFSINIVNKYLVNLAMIALNRPMHDTFEQEMHRKRSYDRVTLLQFVRDNFTKLKD